MLIEKLIDWNEPNREGCIVSDRITKEGFKVGYMYREVPDEDNPDSAMTAICHIIQLDCSILRKFNIWNQNLQ